MSENKINLKDEIYGDYIRIFEDDFIVTRIITEYDKPLTFEECVTIAKEHGFTTGEFFIMAETALSGVIYKYVNCYEGEPYVCQYGETIGYA